MNEKNEVSIKKGMDYVSKMTKAWDCWDLARSPDPAHPGLAYIYKKTYFIKVEINFLNEWDSGQPTQPSLKGGL
jgi:hypothetical protein